ncbi:cytochrome P450 [Actinocorallia sp. API 0066]|uniref:cytochrome P450 n=1 Tax=Actinocorallia sp. API 0066 TaxID=2896846 RepID=UPI001E2BD36E|nr:cytochrome P450 [Actinocorallia sp. API 0066]MCD0447752.1 cytochrome P450 [Actinocorallia sp. API 0066]
MAETGNLWPELDRVPQPPEGVPVPPDAVGVTQYTPMQAAMAWARKLGPIYATAGAGFEMVVVSGADLVAELSDEARFAKHVGFGIDAFRPVTGDGLFTAYNDEPNWRLAHDVLGPAFSREAMERYHDGMLTTVGRLLEYWDARCGADPVDVVDDATKLALETIGRVGFGYDFDSFSRDGLHPLVAAMMETLQYSMMPPDAQQAGASENDRKIKYMHDLVDEVVATRGTSGGDHADLLHAMLDSADAKGEKLTPENIRFQILTFLIAGYGTSAGMLSFALYFLSTHPDVLKRAVAEVDEVLGDGEAPTYETLAKLRYVRRVLDEALRLWPPTPGFMREALQDTSIGGHPMRKGAWALVLVPMLHRDPVWGGDAEAFDPDRFLPEANRARAPHSYKPFGTGARACIGRQFAQHEATLALALILRRYRIQGAPGYELAIREAGFFMPDGFTLALDRR